MNIKKNLLVTLLFLGFTLIVGNFSYAKDYEYKKLDIKADVNIDGTIDVKEIFTTNFLERRHGIVRSIPLDYTVDDTKFLLDISDINVEGSNFSFEKQNGNLEIKIGDDNKTVIGEQIYPISYSAYGLIRNFSGMGYSELYWNLVGYEIDTDVAYLEAELKLPKYNLFTDEDFLITVDGESSSVNDFKGKIDWSEGYKIMIVYDKKLYAGDGITLAIRFPNNYFEFDHDKQSRLLYIDDSKGFEFDYKNLNSTSKVLIYTLGFLIFFFGIMYVSKNWLNRKIKPVKICKDFNSKYPVIVQFTPPKGINSAEAGLLFNCRVDPVDMTSLFYQWVNDKIIEIKCDVDKPDSKKINSITFVKLKDIPEDYPYYEKELFCNLFKNKDSKYVTENSDLSRVVSLEGLEDFGLHKHWLCRRKHLSFLWIILSIIFVALLVLGFYYFKRLGVLFLIFFLPLFCGIAYKQNNKVRFTDEGGKLAAHVVGYAKFIEKCDENQLKTFLERDPLFIDKTLPYAVAFGMETQFLKKVTPLLKDIEQTWLKGGKSGVSFPVGDVSSFMKNILGNVQLDRNLVSFGLNTVNGGWNYKKSNTNFVKHGGDYFRKNWDYSEFKGFDIGSIFAGGGKIFKKGGGGGGGGTKSW